MFKTFFHSKFRFSNELVYNFSSFTGSFNSANIGNLLMNHPSYLQNKDITYQNNLKILNEKANRNFASVIERTKEIVLETKWKLTKNEHTNTSSIDNRFVFRAENHALEFISLVKEKCDELDHHPSWTYTCDNIKQEYVLAISLTSHFANNNVTDKDYELAAYLTYEYEKGQTFYFNNKLRKMVVLSFNVLFTLFIYSYVKGRYEKAGQKYNSFQLTLNKQLANEFF
jgi:pterin-4a-carbinolamine dehydratase